MSARMKIGSLVAAAMLVGAVGAPLVAAGTDIVKARVTGFKSMAASSKVIRDQVREDAPQIPAIQKAASEIQAVAPKIRTWFPAGSGPKPGVKTDAKAEIWSKAADFKAANDDFVAKANALAAAAKSGDVAAIKAANTQLSASCSRCHRAFRNE